VIGGIVVRSFPLAGAWAIHHMARPVEFIKPKVETTDPDPDWWFAVMLRRVDIPERCLKGVAHQLFKEGF
jgi:hypothetical protein